MKRLTILLLLVAVRLAGAEVLFRAGVDEPLPLPNVRGSYVVVMSATTAAEADWAKVADVLRKKHEADLVIVPGGKVSAALPTLRRLRPRMVAFVSRPEETGRAMVVAIHRMMRRLDDDPYGDAQWGILTGYEPADALRQAEREEPLTVGSGFSSMGPGLAKQLGAGFASSETDAKKFWRVDDKGVHEEAVDPDPTKSLAAAFSKTPPHLAQTSGHATERDWQIGYSVKAGQFRCDKGQLYALSTKGKRYDITSKGPTIYMPMGNCLIGHVSKRDCMATAWFHTGGLQQMFGYTVVTFFGYMGWGVNTFFGNGGMSLSQAFHANSQALLHELHTKYPQRATLEFDTFESRDINKVASRYGIRKRDLLGMLWDRDTVAFYGDPAWVARMPVKPRAWSAELTRGQRKAGPENYKLVVSAKKAGKWPNRPLVVYLPERIKDIENVSGPEGMKVVVTDDFILLPVKGEYADNTDIEVTFRASRFEGVPTGANHKPVKLAKLVRDNEKLVSVSSESAALRAALLTAGENRVGLLSALERVKEEQRGAMAFLIANMPEPDLQSMDAGWLAEHVALATAAWENAPWHKKVDEATFRDYILPHVSVDETREHWMPAMRKRCLPLVKDCKTPGEAALALNKKLFKEINVEYHGTKRPKPNQSPSESIAAGYASCTGLSILLVNACRSVGVPARLVGVAAWTGKPGNHTWVEVWDDDKWHPVGAAESWKLGDVWFRDAAAKASARHYLTRIYAARYSQSPVAFPLIWNLGYRHVPGVDVTGKYKAQAAPPPEIDAKDPGEAEV